MIDLLVQTAVIWPVLIPLATAAVTAMFWNNVAAQRIVSGMGVVAMFASSILLIAIVYQGGTQAIQFGAWRAPFGITFVADGLSAAMAAITGLMAFTTWIFGLADIRHREERAGFHPLFHGMLAGVNGSFLTGDIFNLYVWFEVMLITAMGLLVVGRTRAQLDGVLKYAVLNLFSTLLFLCGFGIKAGYFPLFFWLPASYHTASITVSAIFAGLLTKVGVYACFRIFTLIFTIEGSGIREIVAVIAAGTMLFGVFGAAVQWDVRRILSFHIISQIGYMLLGLAIATPLALAGGIFYIIHHIIVKANLFLLAGAIHRATGTFDLRKSGGLMRSYPLLAALFLIPALSLGGIPPLSGFWAKFVVIDATLKNGDGWLAAVALFVGILTLFSMTKIWMEAFWKDPVLPRSTVRRVPASMLVAIAILSSMTVLIGLWAEPFVAYAASAAADLTNPSSYIAAVLGVEAVAEFAQ